MRNRQFFGAILAVASMFAAFAAAIVAAFSDFFRMLEPMPPRLSLDEGGTAIALDGHPLDLALQNELRHESGMKRMAAARGI